MNMIIDESRPIASDRTRVFASDLVAVARVHRTLEASTEQMYLRPDQAVRMAKLALDVGDLTGMGVPADLVLAVAAIGIKPPHELAASGIEGLSALCAAGPAFEEARSVWLEHMERCRLSSGGPRMRAALSPLFNKRMAVEGGAIS